MAIIQYLKDTRGELNHVAWPTRTQTIIFTTLVIALSIFTALYLGLFDYLLTTGLGKVIDAYPGAEAPTPSMEVTTEPIPATTETPDINTLVPSGSQNNQ
ncbi:MAG: preprotein translocase subunit SecE [Minisyncoccia bacterium]